MNVDKQKLKALAKTSTHFTEVGKGDRVEVWDRKKGHRRATYTDMDYLAAANPSAVLELLAEIERLEADNNAMRGSTKRMGEDASKLQKQIRASQRDIKRAERRLQDAESLKTENQDLRMLVKEMDLMFGRYLLGMRASVVEWQKGKGADAAMQWIWNGLRGPGELPPEEETQAQAYFDREVVKIEEGLEEVYAYRDKRRSEKANNTKEAQ
ncbi:hypothetical protein D3C81_1214930 [compost metagenome]